jgi:beta-lactamase class D
MQYAARYRNQPAPAMILKRFVAALGASLLSIAAAQAGDICTVVADAATGRALVQRGDCATRVTPASTFKIAISLMGYDAGFLKDEHHPELPFRPGYVDWRENWKHPADPARWMRDSVVWYSQQVTTALRMPRLQAYTRQFGYGNADVSGDAEHDGLTLSWIGSSLKISPLEQVSFLRKLLARQLGIKPQAYDMTARLLAYQRIGGGWDVSGKTGSASGYGWYVGWAAKDGRTLVFAHLLRRDAGDPEEVPTGVLARDRLLEALPTLAARAVSP